ncbi:MAG: PsbP-related protein [bacterium]
MPENILPSSPVLNPVDTMDVPIASPAPKKFPLLITILIIILTLLATLAIYLFLQVRTMALNNPNSSPSPISSPIPSPDSTSAWQTYQSDEHQISFKYPANYELTESKNYVSIISPLLTATKGYELKDGELKMEIYFNPSPKGDSLEKWASELMQPGATKMNDAIIGGQSATHLQFGTTGGDVYLILKNNSRYQIAKYPVVTSKQSEFDQILSTFKFTN